MHSNSNQNKEMNDCNRNQTIRELSEHYGFSLEDAMSKFGNICKHESFEERLAFFENNIFNKLQPDSPLNTIELVCITELFKYIAKDKLKVDYSLRCETESLEDFYFYNMNDNVENLLKEMIPTFQELYDVFRSNRDNLLFVCKFIENIAIEVATSTNPHWENIMLFACFMCAVKL